jgi:hypothetical protein
VERGRSVFAANCARCHSTQPEPFENVDFRKTDASGMRVDWLGNERATPVSEVGTFPCRALHANHMEGHVWHEYGSETYRARAADPNLADASGGGRGYYRNVSLLGAWAHAPFMHNNAIGPELCGRPRNAVNDHYRSPYVDESGAPLGKDEAPPCVPYDPSVQGRFELYKASMESLLNPKSRVRKVSLLDEPIRLEVGLRMPRPEGKVEFAGLKLEFPAGIPASFFGNFQHKAFFGDLVLAKTRPDELTSRFVQRFGPGKGEQLAMEVRQMADEVVRRPERLVEVARPRLPTIKELYLSCSADGEADGHRFGESLPPEDKKALIAFLATL